MKFTRIALDDWEGYYMDGKLVAEGHTVDPEEILTILGHEIEGKFIEDEDDLEEFGNRLPEDLIKIEEYIIRKQL